MEGQEGYITLKKQDLESLFREYARSNYVDYNRGLMTYEQAMAVLQLKSSAFYDLLNDPNTLLKKSTKIKGRVLAKTVYQEAERLCL